LVNVSRTTDGYWEWFERSESSAASYEITGKYLFFSLNRELLVQIAIEELENGGFHLAKTRIAGVAPPTGDFVLCLYYKDDSRKHELADKYRNRSDVKYRYWKNDSETLAGKYSKEFLDKLPKDMKNVFRQKRV
jgi:hypothetical protein